MKLKNSINKINMLRKHGIINDIMNWYIIIIVRTKHKNRVNSFNPAKNLKQLKILFNILDHLL